MTSSREHLLAIGEAWMEQIWRQRDVEAVDRLHAPEFVDRSPAGRGLDNEAYKAGIAELYRAFPDWIARTEDLLVDPERGMVTIRWTASGTQRGSFFGVPASHRPISFTGIEIIRVADGRVQERWGEWNGIDLLIQIGAWQPPAAP